jgi:hypothetical protein
MPNKISSSRPDPTTPKPAPDIAQGLIEALLNAMPPVPSPSTKQKRMTEKRTPQKTRREGA